jgi:Cof subfamily protein (haloacid dehalogenase superfamily)
MLAEELREQLRGRKVLATDLDGTLLRPDLSVSQATRQAIADAIDGGIHVVFVTGRPPRWMRVVAQETGHAGIAICANGAVVIDLVAEQVMARTTIDTGAAADVAAGLREAFGDGVHFAVERVAVAAMPDEGSEQEFALEDRYRGRLPVPPYAPRLQLAELLALPDVVKMLARLTDGERPGFLPAALALAAGRLEVTHSSSHVLLEFGPQGVTKATALADLVSSLGLSAADVVAVGDMPNDLAMLGWAGLGLAVANGHESVRNAVRHEAPIPAEDGVRQVLRAMLA